MNTLIIVLYLHIYEQFGLSVLKLVGDSIAQYDIGLYPSMFVDST